MSDEQIAAAARLWRQGYDTFAIAKRLFGWVTVTEHSYTPTNYEAIIYNNMRFIRETAHAQERLVLC